MLKTSVIWEFCNDHRASWLQVLPRAECHHGGKRKWQVSCLEHKEGRFVYVPSDDESDAPLKQDILNRLSQFFPHSEVCSGRSKSQTVNRLFIPCSPPSKTMIFWHNPELYQNPSSCVTTGSIPLDQWRGFLSH